MNLLLCGLTLLFMECSGDSDTNSTTTTTSTTTEAASEVDRNRTFYEDISEYSSGLTDEFRNLLMASPVEQPKKKEKQSKKKNNQDLKAKSDDENLKEITQQHIEQLLKFYSKVSEKLLAKNDTKAKGHYHKMGSKHEDKDEDENHKEYLNYVENWAAQHGEKPPEGSFNTMNTNSVPGYGNLNYLNANNFGPPTNFGAGCGSPCSQYSNTNSANGASGAVFGNGANGAGFSNGANFGNSGTNGAFGTPFNGNYAMALRNRMFGYSGPNCCNLCQCGSAYDPSCAQGCGYNYGTTTNTEADNDDDNDSYYGGNGGYGSSKGHDKPVPDQHSHLLNSYTNNPPSTINNSPSTNNNYYQVSDGNHGDHDGQSQSPEESKSRFEFAKHHFSSYPQYYGTWNAYSRPCGGCYNVFEPVNDDSEGTVTTEEPVNSKESIFHLVKPNFGTNKSGLGTNKNGFSTNKNGFGTNKGPRMTSKSRKHSKFDKKPEKTADNTVKKSSELTSTVTNKPENGTKFSTVPSASIKTTTTSEKLSEISKNSKISSKSETPQNGPQKTVADVPKAPVPNQNFAVPSRTPLFDESQSGSPNQSTVSEKSTKIVKSPSSKEKAKSVPKGQIKLSPVPSQGKNKVPPKISATTITMQLSKRPKSTETKSISGTNDSTNGTIKSTSRKM
ncbi:unnamed protein product [Bursaphelenchus okinawaensis]|uniref:Uncharacterized protein n=1 Tax=Bursaphelenchus okinawaensis TaxID=465554 RepID=A0A811KQJ6_9BILA|nr:unnamed protein product [Bursaphelenchus okinawaensis]CAG9108050.1 unnamed protein product [Bursaphelenchus okinawaensis]